MPMDNKLAAGLKALNETQNDIFERIKVMEVSVEIKVILTDLFAGFRNAIRAYHEGIPAPTMGDGANAAPPMPTKKKTWGPEDWVIIRDDSGHEFMAQLIVSKGHKNIYWHVPGGRAWPEGNIVRLATDEEKYKEGAKIWFDSPKLKLDGYIKQSFRQTKNCFILGAGDRGYAWSNMTLIERARGVAKMCEHGNTYPVVVRIPADLSSTGKFKWKSVEIDECISSMVQGLQNVGINMRSSCCGHGKGDGEIVLEDGRVLIIKQKESA